MQPPETNSVLPYPVGRNAKTSLLLRPLTSYCFPFNCSSLRPNSFEAKIIAPWNIFAFSWSGIGAFFPWDCAEPSEVCKSPTPSQSRQDYVPIPESDQKTCCLWGRKLKVLKRHGPLFYSFIDFSPFTIGFLRNITIWCSVQKISLFEITNCSTRMLYFILVIRHSIFSKKFGLINLDLFQNRGASYSQVFSWNKMQECPILL